MLEWATVAPNEVVAHLHGHSYTITLDEDEELWGVEITTPDGGFESEECDTLEDAKRYCESTALNVQAGK